MSLFLFQKHNTSNIVKLVGIYFDKLKLVERLNQNAKSTCKYYVFDTEKENALVCHIVDGKSIISKFNFKNPIQHLLYYHDFANTDTIKALKDFIKISKKNNLYQTNILFNKENFQGVILNRLSKLYDNLISVDTFEKYGKNTFGCVCHLHFDNEKSANTAIEIINKRLGLNAANAGPWYNNGKLIKNAFVIVCSATGNLKLE